MGSASSDFGWATHSESPDAHGDDCGDAMDYLYPAMGPGEGSTASGSSASHRATSPDDPSDDRSFPFFLSASILRQHNQNEYLPERSCYPSHGMGPMGSMSMGMRAGGGCEGQWQAHHLVGRYSEASRHAMLTAGAPTNPHAAGLHSVPAGVLGMGGGRVDVGMGGGRGEDVLAMMGVGGCWGGVDDGDLG